MGNAYEYTNTKNKETGEIIEEGLDDDLWINHGVETVGDFAAMAMYLTHDTEDAIADGKAHYDIEEVISNQPAEIVQQIRDGYQLYSNNKSRVSFTELEKLDEFAFELGQKLGDFDDWYDGLPFSIRSNAKMKTIIERYNRGLARGIDAGITVHRMCIFIKGEPTDGKTYTSEAVLRDDFGLNVKDISGQKTGRYDKVSTHTQALITSDDKISNILNVCDQKVIELYRRCRNNVPWIGTVVVVTSNYSFEDWLRDVCEDKTSDIAAVKSRFFITHTQSDKFGTRLVCDEPMHRRCLYEAELYEKFNKFQECFNRRCAAFSEIEQVTVNSVEIKNDTTRRLKLKTSLDKPGVFIVPKELQSLRSNIKEYEKKPYYIRITEKFKYYPKLVSVSVAEATLDALKNEKRFRENLIRLRNQNKRDGRALSVDLAKADKVKRETVQFIMKKNASVFSRFNEANEILTEEDPHLVEKNFQSSLEALFYNPDEELPFL